MPAWMGIVINSICAGVSVAFSMAYKKKLEREAEKEELKDIKEREKAILRYYLPFYQDFALHNLENEYTSWFTLIDVENYFKCHNIPYKPQDLDFVNHFLIGYHCYDLDPNLHFIYDIDSKKKVYFTNKNFCNINIEKALEQY